jgi:Tn3 transposase DDE domain-containing protein
VLFALPSAWSRTSTTSKRSSASSSAPTSTAPPANGHPRANSVIAYGKGGEIASNRRDEREMSVLCPRALQSTLVYVNTLMLQDILGEPEWADLPPRRCRQPPPPARPQPLLPVKQGHDLLLEYERGCARGKYQIKSK